VLAPGLTGYLLFAFLAWTSQSWRPTMIVYGIAGLVVAGLFWIFVRDQPQDHPLCNRAELDLIDEGRPAAMANPHGRASGLPLRSILTSTSLWCSSLQQFGTNFGWVFLITWLPTYLADVHKVPIVERGLLSGLPIFVGLFGMLAGGWVCDRLTRRLGLRWGRCLPMSLTRFFAMAAYLACLALESPWEVIIAFCVVAVSVDLGTASVWAFMQDIGGKHVGSVLGWGNMWGNVGAALSPLILERVIGDEGNWNAGFVACAGAFFLSGVAALGVDATKPITPPDKEQDNL
jgi:nitrate/nitrite transporter NarK